MKGFDLIINSGKLHFALLLMTMAWTIENNKNKFYELHFRK